MIDPLVPAEVDLRDFAYMPLDVVRLRDSDISVCASGDEFRCAVLLWCASWHQRPAASLPDDDMLLANLAGFGRDVKGWLEARVGAMRGWIKCSDGRLYHPVVAEKANEAWEAKVKQRARTAAARAAKLSQHCDSDIRNNGTEVVTENATISVTENVTGSKGREGNREIREEKELSSLRSDLSDPQEKPKRSPAGEVREILSAVLSPEIAAGVIDHRQKLRKPLTALAARGLVRDFVATGSPDAAAQMMIERGWQGFKPEWFANDRGAAAQPRASPNSNSAERTFDLGGEAHQVTERSLKHWLDEFKKSGQWRFESPKPGEPGCKVPIEFLSPDLRHPIPAQCEETT